MRGAAALFVWLLAGAPACWAVIGQAGYKQPEPGSRPTMPSASPSGQSSGQPAGQAPGGGAGAQLETLLDATQPDDTKGRAWRSDAYYREQARKKSPGQRDEASAEGVELSAEAQSAAAAAAAAGEAPPSKPAMSLADARFNFATVVESFLRNNSDGGYWEMAEPKTGKTLKLTLKSIDRTSLTGVDGDTLHTGTVLMRASGRPRPVPVYFTVDFSGDDWKVVKYSLAKPAPAR